MGGIGIRQRLVALAAVGAVVLQMFLPFAALAAVPGGLGSVICSSAAPSDNPSGHEGCSCAAGCGICSPQMPAVLPEVAASLLPRPYAHGVDLRIDFQVARVRFAPQAARPPPLG
jgi:hypothetical protein